MTLTNPKPLGYAFGELLPSAHVNSVWTQLTNAVDGAGGGSYTLSNPLSFDGDTVEIEDLDVTGSVVGNLPVDGNLDVTGTADFTGLATFSGPATHDGTSFFNDQATFSAPVSMSDDLNASDVNADNLVVTGAVDFSGNTAFTHLLGTTGLGVTALRYATSNPIDTSDTITSMVARVYNGSAVRTTTLDAAALDGACAFLLNLCSQTRAILDGVAGPTLATMSAATGVAICFKVNGNWRVFFNT